MPKFLRSIAIGAVGTGLVLSFSGVVATALVFGWQEPYDDELRISLVAAGAAAAVVPLLLLASRRKGRVKPDRVVLVITAGTIVSVLLLWLGDEALFGEAVTTKRAIRSIASTAAVGVGVAAAGWWLPSYLATRGPLERLRTWLAADAVAVAIAVTLLGGFDTSLAFVAVGAGIVTAALATFWWLPQWQAAQWPAMEAKDRAEQESNARAAVAQLLGGLGLIATVALTLFQVNETRKSSDRTLLLTARAQVNDRFSRAIEQIGASRAGKPALERRLGGIYALQQYVVQSETGGSPEDAELAYRSGAAILSAYLRANAPRRDMRAGGAVLKSECFASRRIREIRPDIAAAVEVLRNLYPSTDAQGTNEDAPSSVVTSGRRDPNLPSYRSVGPVLDLSKTDLSGIDLSGIDLRYADLRDARLVRSDLTGASANFMKAAGIDARGACLASADFEFVDFTEGEQDRERRRRAADLRGVDFSFANLDVTTVDFVDLRQADLEMARIEIVSARGAKLDGTGTRVEGGYLQDSDIDSP